MKWFYDFISFSFYQKVSKAPMVQAFRYLFILTYVTVLISTIFLLVQIAFLLPQFPSQINQFKKRLSTAYPKNLVITIQNGTVSTNSQKPVYVDFPEITTHLEMKHLIIIDPKQTASDYSPNSALFFVTRDSIVYPTDNATETVMIKRIERLHNQKIDYQTYNYFLEHKVNVFLDTIVRIAPWILVFAAIFIPFLASLFLFTWRVLLLVILSCILWLVSLSFKTKFSFVELYKMGVYGLTVPIILSLILNLWGVSIPLVFTSCFLLWMVIVLSKAE